ncbi:hypothetical protein [Streptomyces exfoliatus]|uniref:hypothetical protein n=1 Tax=Streptomyces exfoliatus TaxID=1905 RepID=UPI003C301A3E
MPNRGPDQAVHQRRRELPNDFSTAVNPGEPWTPDSLAAAYRTAYGEFLQKLRARYGAGTTFVAVGHGQFAEHVQQVVKARADAGDSKVRYWCLDGSGLDFSGCHWPTPGGVITPPGATGVLAGRGAGGGG